MRLNTPAMVVILSLIAMVAISISQEERGRTVVVYSDELVEGGEWDLATVPPDRWIGIVSSSEGWDRLPQEIGIGNVTARPRPDFEDNIAVVGYMGMMPTGGHTITVRQVEFVPSARGGRVVVRIVVATPEPEAMVTQALSHPHHTVVIPKAKWPNEALNMMGQGTLVVDVYDQDGRDWGPGHLL